MDFSASQVWEWRLMWINKKEGRFYEDGTDRIITFNIVPRQRGGEFSLIDFPLPNPLKVVNGKLGFIQLIFSFGTNFNLISPVDVSDAGTLDCQGLKYFRYFNPQKKCKTCLTKTFWNVCSSIQPNITIVDEITEIIDKRWPTTASKVDNITAWNQVYTQSLLCF